MKTHEKHPTACRDAGLERMNHWKSINLMAFQRVSEEKLSEIKGF